MGRGGLVQPAPSVILSCAGIGSRLGLGKTKALIDIGGKTLIHWQLALFRVVEDVRGRRLCQGGRDGAGSFVLTERGRL